MDIQVVVAVCSCKLCVEFKNANAMTASGTHEFDFMEMGYDFGFQKLEDPDGEEPVDYAKLASILECRDPSPAVRRRNTADVIRFLSYMDLENRRIGLYDLILICEHIYNEDFEGIIEEGTAAADFLTQIARVFVISWYAVFEKRVKNAEWIARKIRRFLTHILAVPIIAGKVASVFFMEENWPSVGPISLIERMCKEMLICMDTVSLICNLTRIEDIPEYLDQHSKYVTIIQGQFASCCARIRNSDDDLGGLLLMLFINMSILEGFLKFLIEKNNGYFMNIVLVDLMEKAGNYEGPRSTVWPFLRNLSLCEKGRQTIMENLELYLGHLLYPIAGPEKLPPDETINLPLEVADLPETKTRVQDKRIRECILDTLYSLCRYRKDRVLLRKADIYQILKHYHLAEDDPHLISKIEDIVNILIRHEGSELEVDDLLEGLSLNPNAASCSKFSQAFMKSPPLKMKLLKDGILIDGTLNDDTLNDGTLNENKPEPERIVPARVVPEDADFLNRNVNPCTNEILSSDRRVFNYNRFLEFNRLRFLYFQARRMQKGTNGQSTQDVDPNEKFLKSKFEDVYGPVNFENPLMQAVLKIMKESVVEIALAQPRSPETMLQLLDEDIDTLDSIHCPDLLDSKIKAKFKPEEQLKYSKMDPAESEGEWFVLPRLPLKDIREEHFPGYDDLDEEKATDLAPLTNLHVYDPKEELCFAMPYRIFRRDEECEIGRMLSCRILEHLNRFPLGVSEATFWETFIKVHGWTPQTAGWTEIPTLNALLHRHDKEMYIVDEPCHVIFQGSLEGVINAEIILRRLWHVIKCLLSKLLFIPTDDILDVIKNKYGFAFNPQDWNFDSINDFLNFLVTEFSSRNFVQVYRQHYTEDFMPKHKDYLMFRAASVKKTIEMLHGVETKASEHPKAEKRMRRRIPRRFLRENSTIECVSNNLITESVLLADVKCIHDPGMICVVLVDQQREALQFQFELQECTMTSRFLSEYVHKERLRLGMCVMAYIKWRSYGPYWFRVRVLWKDQHAEDTYEVFGIDFGFLEPAKIKDMRYMPRSKIGDVPAAAVIVSLYGVVHPSGRRLHRWETKLVDNVIEQLTTEDDYFQITLLSGHYEPLLGCKIWSITCDILTRENLALKHRGFNKLFSQVFSKELTRWKNTLAKNEQSKEKSGQHETPPSASG